ncbi:1-(5-phosphoribosyl)-5-[(5-phosphoribosylamino) methylideneamino] imidazole-4-carboxamide isomerase [Planctomycetia bacterium]|nr:1-(5-phosphoribosyl)-5-[(5-phosphoribosylamino) methylideneamino] imidazole-4-carboxamide isomerase [Planctomycetia bacterium]
MTAPPLSIKSRQQEGVLELQWSHGTYRLPFRFLRGRCPCASCVNEVTGVRMVDVEDVPLAVAPTNIQFSGNYAIKISWNDRHDTGLFTWEYLELLSNDLATAAAS